MLTRRTPLMRGGRLKPVSAKRVKVNRIYSALRKKYLQDHPYCEVWLARRGYTEADVDFYGRVVGGIGSTHYYIQVPMACDIHHRKGRGRHLLDTSTWMSSCRPEHEFIHSHQGEARKLGLLI